MKFHFLYETTNMVNGKIYRGKHSTKNMNDSYLGSGVLLRAAIKKYGKENFARKIVKTFDTAKELSIAEREWVTEEFVLSDSNYNLAIGGHGGDVRNFYKNHTPKEIAEKAAATLKANEQKLLARNAKVALSTTHRPREVQISKASRMREFITADSRAEQGKALSRTNNIRMNAFLQELITHKDLPVKELKGLFPKFSTSSIRRGLSRLESGQTIW